MHNCTWRQGSDARCRVIAGDRNQLRERFSNLVDSFADEGIVRPDMTGHLEHFRINDDKTSRFLQQKLEITRQQTSRQEDSLNSCPIRQTSFIPAGLDSLAIV